MQSLKPIGFPLESTRNFDMKAIKPLKSSKAE
jgi:hypothetical protein